jgi:radical SAM protein with 4Fe4S-binding SPASM domain
MFQLDVLLGTACDAKCPYCVQATRGTKADKTPDIPAFAAAVASRVQDLNRLKLWGGEPMMYVDRLISTVQALAAHGVRPRVIVVTTNGHRIPDEYVGYANIHPEVHTNVSWHDGLTDDQLDAVFKLRRLSVSTLVHHKRTSLWEMKELSDKCASRYGRRPATVAQYVYAVDGCSPDYAMTKDDVDEFCRHVRRDVMPLAASGDEWAGRQLVSLSAWRRLRYRRSDGAMCVRKDQLSVDLHGSIYQCHHDFHPSTVVGSLFGKVIPIAAERSEPNKYYRSEECQRCWLLDECRGGCFRSWTHDVDCYRAKRLHELFDDVDAFIGGAYAV